MKFYVRSSVIVVLFVTSCSGRNIAKKVDLMSVSSFENIRQFYANIKTQRPMVRPKEGPDDERTKTICKNILRSHYFRVLKDEEWVDVDDDDTFAKLKEFHPTVFLAIFREYAICRKDDCWEYDYIYKYQNSYTVLPIYIDDDKDDEYVFKCLAKKKDSSNVIIVYHISREYNVVLDPERAVPIAGRFVFSYHPEKFAVLEAVAEEAAKTSKSIQAAPIEFYYSKRRNDNGAAKNSNQDPVCKLASHHKLRLCASLFASSAYRDEVEFSPTIENVEPECAKRRISFVADLSIRRYLFLKFTGRSLASRNYEEWTFGCRALSAKQRKPITYHVSRGDDRNTIFVFVHKFSDDRIFVENYLRQVTVVDGVNEEEVRLEEDKQLGEFSYKSRSARVK